MTKFKIEIRGFCRKRIFSFDLTKPAPPIHWAAELLGGYKFDGMSNAEINDAFEGILGGLFFGDSPFRRGETHVWLIEMVKRGMIPERPKLIYKI